jgi:GntR family transcriptional regulator
LARVGPAGPTKRGELPRLKELEHSPLVLRAREAILAAILEGEFETRLPPEDELAIMLNVSRTTVRAAVQDLERDGLITRRRATGTVINRHVGFETLALQRLVDFDWLLKKQGHEVRVDVSWERRVPSEAAGLLPLDAEADFCVIQKHYLAGGKLAIALRDYVPASELRTTRLKDPLESSVFEFSRRHCHRAIANAVVQIVPMVVANSKTTDLELKRGEPFVRLLETHFDDQGQPVAWSIIDLDDKVVRLEVFRAH